MAGVAAQDRWRRRGRALLVRRHVEATDEHRTGVRPPSRVPPSSFKGAACRTYESGWHSVAELTMALPHSAVQWWGWPHGEGWQNNAGIWLPDASEGWRVPAGVKALNVPVGGAGTGAECPREPRASGPHPRGRPALERGGVLSARCCVPQARRSFARGCLGQLFWWAAGATRVAFMLCVFWACEFCLCLCFVFYERKWVSPGSLGDPYGCPRQ
jgi:hypothetical protein